MTLKEFIIGLLLLIVFLSPLVCIIVNRYIPDANNMASLRLKTEFIALRIKEIQDICAQLKMNNTHQQILEEKMTFIDHEAFMLWEEMDRKISRILETLQDIDLMETRKAPHDA